MFAIHFAISALVCVSLIVSCIVEIRNNLNLGKTIKLLQYEVAALTNSLNRLMEVEG